ncbi:MarR family winged helix-turn-helix transcriptional regulator [Mycetocola zhadangensis]|uniref:MarR family winged helix-turn-helix transcriptional regulator n=1 Tax=Mycetocola zhadangensis TaxID=1164595 RepID=UPI003A4DF7E4
MRRAFEGTGLTASRTHLLWVLAELGASPQQALASALGVSARNVTALVDALERGGYVQRTAHATDRRSSVVVLTPLGERVMAEMAADHERLGADLLRAVAPGDREAFLRGLDAISSQLDTLVRAAEAEQVAEKGE